ncbi:MAG: aspartate aminotransferase family protein [Candidatus Sericytochromatia bacterium]
MNKNMNIENQVKTTNFEQYFLSNSSESINEYQKAMTLAVDAIKKSMLENKSPYTGKSYQEIFSVFRDTELLPQFGKSIEEVMADIEHSVIKDSVFVNNKLCMAHLHCSSIIPALSAEIIISALNQSMDSWDQSPSATAVEQFVLDELCKMYNYGELADGIFTSGGTQSNFMGLLLARDNYSFKNLNWSIKEQGLPAEFGKFRILCSDVAHFTVKQSASILGLGYKSVVTIETDNKFRMKPESLKSKIQELKSQGLIPIAVVATAGTTDFGSIDPLDEVSKITSEENIWLHVDGAVGSALILSDKNKYKIKGIENADSIAVDFHKLMYQPVSCSAFLVKDKRVFDVLKLNASYLNPEINEDMGINDLVGKSIQTTKRFDALKTYMSFQIVGKQAYGDMLDHIIDVANQTSELVKEDENFELATEPTISSVVFRYITKDIPAGYDSEEWHNYLNDNIKLNLLLRGDAIIGQTVCFGQSHLKFTVLNPLTQMEDIKAVLHKIKKEAKRLYNLAS